MRFSSLCLCFALVGCATDPTTTNEDIAATTIPPTCTPQPPINPARCDPHEPAPPPPPIAGKCTVELRVNSVSFATGQGWLEGRAEAASKFTATDIATGTVTTGAYPAAGDIKMDVDKDQIANVPLGSYVVDKGKTKKVQVCATFTEYDWLSADDVGIDCDTITLSCPQGTANDTLSADLCKGGDCTHLNGKVSANVKIETKDADGDCVENADDFTPDPCDEALKGQKCRGSIVYFAYEQSPIYDLVQFVGTDLGPAMTGYDRVALLIDDDQIGPFNLNLAAQGLATTKMPPTEQNFFAAIQDMTARGCDMDIWMFSHGQPLLAGGPGDPATVTGGSVTAMADDDMSMTADITTDELLAATDPLVAGTPSLPVRMTYGTPCYYEKWNDAWRSRGAKVTSGALKVNFAPTYYGNFVASWNANDGYGLALATERTTAAETLAFDFVKAQALVVPWFCNLAANGPTGLGCARDFFTDSDLQPLWDSTGHLVDGADTAAYILGGPVGDLVSPPYDPTATGVVNMRRSSQKVMLGTATIKKNMLGLTW